MIVVVDVVRVRGVIRNSRVVYSTEPEGWRESKRCNGVEKSEMARCLPRRIVPSWVWVGQAIRRTSGPLPIPTRHYPGNKTLAFQKQAVCLHVGTFLLALTVACRVSPYRQMLKLQWRRRPRHYGTSSRPSDRQTDPQTTDRQ
jgi:hypothetical protein